MKVRVLAAAWLVAGAFLSAAQVEAVSITGNIGFSGSLNSSQNLATITTVDIVDNNLQTPEQNANVDCTAGPGACTGDYAQFNQPVPGLVAIYNDFSLTSGASPLWTLTVGAQSFGFNLTTVNVLFQDSSFLNVTGTGVAFGTGFDPTPYDFSFTATGSGFFRFASTNTAGSVLPPTETVPEPGSLLVLGVGLVGLATAARRARSRK